MHPNPAFRKTPAETNLAFARERGFGILSVSHDDGPLFSHVPFVLSDDGKALDLHLVRSNPILKALPARAVVAVSGPDGYISPDWYGIADQVPTWNYVAVHLRGRIETRPQDRLHRHLNQLSAKFEARLPQKPPWTSSKMTPEVLDRMMRTIVPCRLHIDDVQGTWKLGQNKPEEARQSAARETARDGIGQELAVLSALMLAPPGE